MRVTNRGKAGHVSVTFVRASQAGIGLRIHKRYDKVTWECRPRLHKSRLGACKFFTSCLSSKKRSLSNWASRRFLECCDFIRPLSTHRIPWVPGFHYRFLKKINSPHWLARFNWGTLIAKRYGDQSRYSDHGHRPVTKTCLMYKLIL